MLLDVIVPLTVLIELEFDEPPLPVARAKLGSVRSSIALGEHPMTQPNAPNTASPEAVIDQRTFRIFVSRVKKT